MPRHAKIKLKRTPGMDFILFVPNYSSTKSEFGPKNGAMLYQYCRGNDERELKDNEVRKSVSTEVTWGVRFSENDKAEKFVLDMCSEVSIFDTIIHD